MHLSPDKLTANFEPHRRATSHCHPRLQRASFDNPTRKQTCEPTRTHHPQSIHPNRDPAIQQAAKINSRQDLSLNSGNPAPAVTSRKSAIDPRRAQSPPASPSSPRDVHAPNGPRPCSARIYLLTSGNGYYVTCEVRDGGMDLSAAGTSRSLRSARWVSAIWTVSVGAARSFCSVISEPTLIAIGVLQPLLCRPCQRCIEPRHFRVATRTLSACAQATPPKIVECREHAIGCA
jgi:hypothetical protein